MILVFSGTGNSLSIARQLSSITGDNIMTLSPDVRLPSDIADNRVVWVFPVYSWGVPPVVVSAIRHNAGQLKGNVPHYAVMTCGDDVGRTNRQWRNLMADNGWNVAAAWSVQMPNTYVLMKGFDIDKPEVVDAKLSSSKKKVTEIARQILSGYSCKAKDDDVVAGTMAWLKSAIVYPWFKRFAMSPKPFHATEACIGCGICAATCPLGNITMQSETRQNGSRPQWDKNCALCLRCYHICPRHCVAYGKATEGKGQYRNLIDSVRTSRQGGCRQDEDNYKE